MTLDRRVPNIDSECGAFRLHHGSDVAGAKTCNQRYGAETFLAYQSNFHTLAIWHDGQNREEARIAEITGFQGLAGFVDHLTQP